MAHFNKSGNYILPFRFGILTQMRRYLLEITVFVCGACVMILELVGSRILAPFVGTSIVTWTSLIGIILASLSFGYFFGGRVADKNPTTNKLSQIIFFSSLAVISIIGIRLPSFYLIGALDLLTRAVVATIILFSLPSFLLGMVSPFAAKLKLDSVKKTGGVIGNLSALSTFGSIFGTFLSGFFLISNFTTTQILAGVGLMLFIISSFLVTGNKVLVIRRVFIFTLVGLALFILEKNLLPKNVFATNTQYNNVMIYETEYYKTGRVMRVMSLDGKYDSGMYLDTDELVFDYSKFYHLAEAFTPKLADVLVIGGAGYTTPKDFLKRYPQVRVDTVEIDPKLTELAKEYFQLQDDPRHQIFHEDGRTFLNRAVNEPKKYDAILIDAFKGYSMPFQLTTRESMQQVHSLLNEDGVLLANVISSIEGDSGKFLRAEFYTLRSIFPYVYVVPVTDPDKGGEVQNLMLIAAKNDLDEKKLPLELQRYWENVWQNHTIKDSPLLTDDFAPVDQYMLKTLY